MKMTQTKTLIAALTACTAIAAGSANAATLFDDAAGVGTNGYFDGTNNRIGQGGSTARFAAIALFSVQDILTDTGLTVGELASTDFELSFDTLNNILLPTAGTYTVGYLGFVANADTADQNWWKSVRLGFNESTAPSTGVADTLANQTGITSPTFNLAGITESDSANDYVVVGVGYSSQQPTSTLEYAGNFELSVIPEPGSLALLGLGGLLIGARRRRD